MTESEMINKLQFIVGEDDSQEVCKFYLDIAGEKIINKAYPFSKAENSVPPRYQYLQIEIAAYLMNKRGAEGQTSHEENGIKRSYSANADVPNSLLNQVVPYVGV